MTPFDVVQLIKTTAVVGDNNNNIAPNTIVTSLVARLKLDFTTTNNNKKKKKNNTTNNSKGEKLHIVPSACVVDRTLPSLFKCVTGTSATAAETTTINEDWLQFCNAIDKIKIAWIKAIEERSKIERKVACFDLIKCVIGVIILPVSILAGGFVICIPTGTGDVDSIQFREQLATQCLKHILVLCVAMSNKHQKYGLQYSLGFGTNIPNIEKKKAIQLMKTAYVKVCVVDNNTVPTAVTEESTPMCN